MGRGLREIIIYVHVGRVLGEKRMTMGHVSSVQWAVIWADGPYIVGRGLGEKRMTMGHV